MPRGAPWSPRLSCAVSVFLVCLCGCFDASSVRHMPTQYTYSQQTSSRQQKGSLMKYGRMRGGSFVPQLFFDPSEGSDCDPAVFDWSGIEASRRQRLRLRGGFDNAQWNGEDIGTDSALGYHKLPKQGCESSESSSDDEECSFSIPLSLSITARESDVTLSPAGARSLILFGLGDQRGRASTSERASGGRGGAACAGTLHCLSFEGCARH